VQGEDLQAFLSNVAQYIASGNCVEAASYLSWMRQRRNSGIDLPYKPYNALVLNQSESGSPTFSESMSQGRMNASFHVALLPHMHDISTMSELPGLQTCSLTPEYLLSPTTPMDSLGYNATLIQCDLVNNKYTTTFKYLDGSQDLDIRVIKSDAGIEVDHGVWWGSDPRSCLQSLDDPTPSTDCRFDDSLLWRLTPRMLAWNMWSGRGSSAVSAELERRGCRGGGGDCCVASVAGLKAMNIVIEAPDSASW
jgi:hypothetical protein